MVKHWPLKRGFANFNNEMVRNYIFPHLELKKFNGSLGRCIMFEIQWFHTRFYIGWYYKTQQE